MRRKIIVILMFSIFIANFFTATNLPPAFAESQKRVFRLLAIEQMFDSCYMRSAQLFIKELLKYPNWNNSTDDYVSYINLFSMYDYSEIDDEVKPFWTNRLFNVFLKDEIKNFLSNTAAGEIVILYYCGHSQVVTRPPPVHSEFLGISPEELRDLVNSTLSNNYLTLILDTCYSGYWLDFSPRSNVLAACKKSQFAWGWCWEYGFFTKGLMDGFQFANELNDDGWLSFAEVFHYAENNTEIIEDEQNPQAYFGAEDGDLPLIQRDPTRPFPNWDCAVTDIEVLSQKVEVGKPVLINVTVKNQGAKKATFAVALFVNSTLIETQRITLLPVENTSITCIWSIPGVYGQCLLNITAKASVCPGELNLNDNAYSKCFPIRLMLKYDLNINGSVDIADILIAAESFGSEPQNPRWNEDADINQDGYVGIQDLVLIAGEFGRSI